MTHLILYDAPCSVCNASVRFIHKRDTKKKFRFSSLTGQAARSLCNTISIPEGKTVVLIENYQSSRQKIWMRSKAVFRTLWLLGGAKRTFAWLYLLPAWMMDWGYNAFAKRRKQVCKVCPFDQKDFVGSEYFLP